MTTVALFCLASVAGTSARAAPAVISLPAEPLAQAFNDLAENAGVNVLYSEADVAGLTGHAVRRAVSAAAAVRQIVQGTGLTVQQDAAGTFVIHKPLAGPSGPVKTPGKRPAKQASAKARSENVMVRGQRYADGIDHRDSTGGGMMVAQTEPKAVSELTAEFISKQSATLTPAALIANLPGIQSDNQGALSVGNDTLHIRGLDDTEIGVLFEGVPYANPFTYAPNTSSIVDNENIRSISVMQGSIDLMAPLWNADGAQVSTSEIRPHDHVRLSFDGTGGTHSLQKEFVRGDTGYIGHTGVKAFLSFSYSHANNWRGPGFSRRWHVDAGASKKWRPGSYSDLIFSFNDQKQTNYLNPNLAQWSDYGQGYGYTGTYTPGQTNYYAYNMKPTRVYMVTLKNHFDLGKGFGLDVQPYYLSAPGWPESMSNLAYSNGYLGSQQYQNLDGYPAQSGSLPTVSIHPNMQQSSGLTMIGRWKRGHNTFSLSYWYSYVAHTEVDHYYALSSNGAFNENTAPISVDGRTFSTFNINGFQQVNALALEDRLALLGGRLTLDAGAKFTMLSRQFSEDLPPAEGAVSKARGNIFIPTPQVTISYRLDHHQQIYVNGTSGFHAPKAYQAQVPAYSSSTGRPSTFPMSTFDPEFMIGEEIGYRYTGSVMFNLSLFNYNMTHHQISSQSYQANSSYLLSQTIDAGGETARGAQMEMGTKPWHGVSFYGSVQYMHTSIDNNVATSGDYLPTKGKEEVGAPKLLGRVGLIYDDGTNFATFNFRYTDSQYSTLMNDQGIPSYFTADLSMGRHLPVIASHLHSKIQLNLINLGNVHYLSSVAGYGLTARNRTGIFGTSISSNTPSYIVGSGFAAFASLTATFE